MNGGLSETIDLVSVGTRVGLGSETSGTADPVPKTLDSGAAQSGWACATVWESYNPGGANRGKAFGIVFPPLPQRSVGIPMFHIRAALFASSEDFVGQIVCGPGPTSPDGTDQINWPTLIGVMGHNSMKVFADTVAIPNFSLINSTDYSGRPLIIAMQVQALKDTTAVIKARLSVQPLTGARPQLIDRRKR